MDEPVENEYWEPSDEAESAVGPGQRPDNSEVPAAIDPGELVTYSGTPDVEYESSPDVAPDGSIQTGETDTDTPLPSKRASSGVWGIPVELLALLALAALLVVVLLLL